jgi:predicted HD phosphohydrolase
VTLADLLELLRSLGSVPSPEADGFTELDHGLQCAHELSLTHPDDDALQVAGLVHDIGHRFGDDEAHGRAGAAVVRAALGPRVAGLVEAHVTAKRYLVATDPAYALSPVSVATLSEQGGALTPDEARAFEASPWFTDAVALRHADDAAKVAGRVVRPLDQWEAVVARVALGASR